MFHEQFDVLDGHDEVILNLLPPQPPPAGAFESMVLCSLVETAFDQFLPPSAVFPGLGTFGQAAQGIASHATR